MNPHPIKKVYLLDTNILIEFSLWLPIDLYPSFWKNLAASLAKNEWVLLDEVVAEIKYNKPLEDWCKEQKQRGYITKVSDEDRERAIVINSTYKMIDAASKNSTADTYLLAHAEANQLTILSREGNRKKETDLFKIPDTCKELHIPQERKPRHFYEATGLVE